MRVAMAQASRHSSKNVVYAGIAGNVLVAIVKFVAAAITQSSAMLSEAVHSLVDTGDQLLMLYGIKRASLPADPEHPLGHGRELYFWTFVVSILIFSVGAGVSVYEGIHHILNPVEIQNPVVNYIVLALAAIFEAGSWWVAFQEFRARKGDLGYFEAAQETKDPSVLLLFLEDSAALIGIAIAFAGTGAAQAFGEPAFDGAASIAIGLLLAVVAIFLARESKKLLIGEGARGELVTALSEIARAEPGISHFNGLLTFQIGPRQVVVAMSVAFRNSLTAPEIEAVVERLENRIRAAHPEVIMLLVKPQTEAAWREARRRRMTQPAQSPP
jgi:cation diffusion facilitator family transporter